MAHRAEEKERRRQERIAQEEAARKAAARRRTLQVGGGVVLGLAVIAVVAIVALAGGGGSKDNSPANISKLTADAKAAGCTFSQFKSEGRNHTASKVTYKTNPPTSGNHNPTPAAGRHLPRRQLAAQGELRPHARARAHRVPVQAGHARRRRGQAAPAGRGALQRHRRLPRPALRERHEHAGPVRRDGMDEVDHLPDALHRRRSGPCASSAQAFTDKGPEFIP